MEKLIPNDRLRELRLNKQLSREQVGAYIGTSSFNVGRWERGEAAPGEDFVTELCELFQVQPEELGISSKGGEREREKKPLFDPAIPLNMPSLLIGRTTLLTELTNELCTEDNKPLLAISGLPGVGKTALAVALAHDESIRTYFTDGILWAGLGPRPNLIDLLGRWGRLLGIPSTILSNLKDKEDWAITLRSTIGTRRMLLVIDDAWEVEEALAFKVGGIHCKHLITTRSPVLATSVAAEHTKTIYELGTNESLDLLKQIAPQVVKQERDKALELVKAVGGLPLALTLMGNYLRLQVYSGQSRRIQRALEQLSHAKQRLELEELRGPGEKHPSLDANTSLSLQSIIAVTDQQLSDDARAALYALAVFPAKPNSFAEEAALVVAGCPAETLDTLVDTSLLESNGSNRYMLHQTIADYALVQREDAAAFTRFITYYIDFAQKHVTEYELLDTESTMLLKALAEAAKRQQRELLVACVNAFTPFLLLRGMYTRIESYVRQAYTAAQELGDIQSQTNMLRHLGEIAIKQGSYTQAEQDFRTGLTLARKINNAESISIMLSELGSIIWRKGSYEQAKAYLLEALTIAQESGNSARLCDILNTLGSVYASLGEYGPAEQALQKGLTIARESKDREKISLLLLNLGVTQAEQGHDAEAKTAMQEGLNVARQIGHREWTTVLLLNLGEMAVDQDEPELAETYYQEALALARQVEHVEWISIVLLSLGKMMLKQRNIEQAETYLNESQQIAERIQRPRILCSCMYEFGNLYLLQNRLEDAEQKFKKMRDCIPERDQEMSAISQFGLAKVAAAQGKINEARKLGEESSQVLAAVGHRTAVEVKEWLKLLPEQKTIGAIEE